MGPKNYLFWMLGLTVAFASPTVTFARPKVVAGRTYCDCACQTAETNKSLAWEKVASCSLNGRSCTADGKPGTLANCQECKGDSSGGYSSCQDAKRSRVAISSRRVGEFLSQMAFELANIKEDLSTSDLAPLTTPGAIPPEGFCRRNIQGQLLVTVYNQGVEGVGPSKTVVAFAGEAPNSLNTPPIAGRAGTELVIDIPNSCFDATNRCSFSIAVDTENSVAESDEANNVVAGVCGAQIQ